MNTTNNSTTGSKTIGTDPTFRQAMSDFGDRMIEQSRIEDEDSPEYQAGEEKVSAAWNLVRAAADAFISRQ